MEKDSARGLEANGDKDVKEPSPSPLRSQNTYIDHGVGNDNALQPLQTTRSNHITLSEVEPVDVQVRDLSVSVAISAPFASVPAVFRKSKPTAGSKPPKQILRDVSASMPSGSLSAIIGGSGSGKTTMLSSMAGRMTDDKVSIDGLITFNGTSEVNGVRSAYVMQQDILLSTLSARETLRFAADLRLPPPTTAEQRHKVVENVILELGLKECAETRIGTHQHTGCSGGEKRRISIGVQLLSNPSVLFLDEPTTGLDATSAFQLVRTLRALARKGRTVVMTIHQPRSEIWGMFDKLVILTRGSPVYSGAAKDCLSWFQGLGMELPHFVNPAEFLIDIASVDNRSTELETRSMERIIGLKTAWQAENGRRHGAALEKSSENRLGSASHGPLPHTPFIRQTHVLTMRAFLQTYRDPMGMASSLLEAILMGLLSGWIFLNLGRDQAGIRSREGALYNAAALQGYLVLLYETYRLTLDIRLFDREHNENVVDVIPFLLSRRLARFLTEDFPVPLIYSIIFYFMTGFRREASTFLIFFSVNLLTHYTSVTFAMACVATSRHFPGASLIANMGYTLQSFACGFFVQSNQIPIYLRWLKWTAYCFYAFGALCANEFVGQFYDCPQGNRADPACAQYTGSYIMNSLGFPEDWIVRPLIAILSFSILFYIYAGICLKVKGVEIAIAKVRASVLDLSAGKEKMAAGPPAHARTVDIRLVKFALGLEKRTMLGRALPTKTILRPVSAHFQAGILNVIMGPSGSGKTSLLNSMAMRLKNSTRIRYTFFGKMTINGAVPSESVIRSVCSYVCQDDDALLPALTVRETLRFAASLRLPSFMSASQKNQRAEDVLLKMGLKDCADTIIGSELIKGISGGERRRVTIAVQILTDPRVLLLDEPTSGLDAFTTSSIMDVLRGLAQEGRTLILTIHQSRSDLFRHFGNVLLLARGGAPVYSGTGEGMLPHFESLGYSCPKTTNPADFALDLVTVDLQQADREAVTREKVRSLISSWSSADCAALTEPTVISTPAGLGSLLRQPASFIVAYPILLHRAFISLRRQPPLMLARIMQVLGLAIIMTLFFAPLQYNYEAIQSRVGLIQQICAFYFVGMLQNVSIYPAEKAVFYRENDDGTYGVTAFFLQYLTLEVPFEVITSLLFAILLGLPTHLPRNAHMFFALFFNCFCIVSCGESLGIMFNTLFTHTGFAVSLTSVFLSVAQIMTGVLSINMPSFLRAVNHLSPLRYAVRALYPYSLQDVEFTCDDAQRLSNGNCTISDGKAVLQLYQLGDSPGLNMLALGVATVIYRVLAWLLLKSVRERWGASMRRKARTRWRAWRRRFSANAGHSL